MRSHERAFILCGIAEDPTCPSLNPSVTSSSPAIKRMVMDSDDGPAPNCTNAEITSRSRLRGYTCPTESNRREIPK